MTTTMKDRTIAPIRGAEPNEVSPEFARTETVGRMFGLRRGTLYNLFNDGKIKSSLLRVRGNKSGVRLWNVASIRDHINRAMNSELETTVRTRFQAAEATVCEGGVQAENHEQRIEGCKTTACSTPTKSGAGFKSLLAETSNGERRGL